MKIKTLTVVKLLMIGQILLTLLGMYEIYRGNDIIGIFNITLQLLGFGINILNLEIFEKSEDTLTILKLK